MFIRNLSEHDYRLTSFEGYVFTLPAKKVCAIWEPAGEHIVKHLQKVETKVAGEGGSPALFSVKKKDWDGETYAEVKRFSVDIKRISGKNDLLRLAEKRGVPKEIMERLRNEEAESEEIVKAINNLPISEEIRFPERNAQTE